MARIQATISLQVHSPLININIKYKTCQENERVLLSDECFVKMLVKTIT